MTPFTDDQLIRFVLRAATLPRPMSSRLHYLDTRKRPDETREPFCSLPDETRTDRVRAAQAKWDTYAVRARKRALVWAKRILWELERAR